MIQYDLIIVGSGPAVAGFLHGLDNRVRRILILDASNVPSSEEVLKFAKIKSLPVAEFRHELELNSVSSVKGIEKKDFWGSFAAHIQNHPSHFVGQDPDTKAYSSLGFGGFSTVWGASVLPFLDNDIKDWPINRTDLESHYRSVSTLWELQGSHDDAIEELFGDLTAGNRFLAVSPYAQEMLDSFSRKKIDDLYCGVGRLALEHPSACTACLACLKGCLFDVPFTSVQTLRQIIKAKEIDFLPGKFVSEVESAKDGHGIWVHTSSADGTRQSYRGAKVVLGAGTVSTASIILASIPEINNVKIIESQYFMFPILKMKPKFQAPVSGYSLHQVAVGWKSRISGFTTHLQLYFYNMYVFAALLKVFKFRSVANFLANNIVIAQGYLHSDVSDHLEMKRTSDRTFHLKRIKNPRYTKALRTLRVRSFVDFLKIGYFTLPFMIRRVKTGSSYHLGGSFPMSSDPKKGNTRISGELFDFNNLFIIDASTLPSIPATTITYTVMANAHRIAKGF